MKEYRLIVTDTAKADLRSIHDFIAEESPQAAERFTKDLANELHRLVKRGMTGSPRDWISPGLLEHLDDETKTSGPSPHRKYISAKPSETSCDSRLENEDDR